MSRLRNRPASIRPCAVTGPNMDWRERIGRSRNSVLLDGAPTRGSSYFFEHPLEIIRTDNPDHIPELLARLDLRREEGYYVAGYLSYEALATDLQPPAPDSLGGGPLLWFGIYEKPIRIRPGTISGEIRDDYHLFVGDGVDEWSQDAEQRERFQKDLKEIKQLLEEGECYQINYTLENLYHFNGNSLSLYLYLRKLQPAGFCALIRHEERHILSLSPELFFHLQREPDEDGSRLFLETRPIKGTAPRSGNEEKDWEICRELAAGAKTRAENIMIVDLLRNDLGICCRPGSIRTGPLLAVESLPTLHQLYSVIRGEPDRHHDNNFFAMIMPALFPCGSVTGAPKKAAQQFIHRLEKRQRGVYTGAIGFAAPRGAEPDGTEALFNVAIRTLEIAPALRRARLGSGCGIVWDSDPAAEWEEYRLKRSFLLPALDCFRIIETMRIEGGKIVFLRDHLRRLSRTMRHFQIEFDRRKFKRKLRTILRRIARGDLRLRLTVDRNGEFEPVLSPLSDRLNRLGCSRGEFSLLISRERIWSGDPFRRFKTSERRLYDRELQEARLRGFAGVLFLNERNEVVEEAIHNLLLYDGRGGWLTPPPEAGALPGILLNRLLQNHPDRISRRKIQLRDIAASRFVFVCNSVQGLRRVTRIIHGTELLYSQYHERGATDQSQALSATPTPLPSPLSGRNS